MSKAWTLAALLLMPASVTTAADLPLVFRDDFENGVEHWTATDSKAWKLIDSDGGHAYSLFGKSDFKPPHRSPLNIALLNDVYVGDFVLEARLRSTTRDYGHRDLCLVFGYQDPAHFYYVHFGKQGDDHANQIFIVNGADRVKISTETTPGTNWTNDWHRVKIERRIEDGRIEVYFDDMAKPAMRALDKTFVKGRIGIGSFDDTGDWDDIKLYGKLLDPIE